MKSPKFQALLKRFKKAILQKHVTQIAADEIQRGKANFALLMTLPTAERDFWLFDKMRNQSYFDTMGMRVYYRDTVQHVSQRLNANARSLEHAYEVVYNALHSNVYSYVADDKKTFLIDEMLKASAMLLQDLKNANEPIRHCIGEICKSDGTPIEDDVDLVSLYSMSQCIPHSVDPVQSVFDRYNLPKEVFDPVPVDERTNWSMKISPPESEKRFADRHMRKTIIFRDLRNIVGSVIVDEEKGLIPYTLWRKGKTSKGLGLHLPFASPMPLWNLHTIQNHPDRTVLLSEDLVVAEQLQSELDERIRKEIKEKEDAIFRDKLYGLKREDLEFEEKLKDTVLNSMSEADYKISGATPNLDWKYADAEEEGVMTNRMYWTARIAIALNLDVSIGIDHAFPYCIDYIYCNVCEWSGSRLPFREFTRKVFKDYGTLTKKTKNGFDNNCVTPGVYEKTKKIYQRILEVVERYRREDRGRASKAEREILESEQYCFSSWFGQEHTVDNINWRPLRLRDVIYIIPHRDEKSYSIALVVADKLRGLAKSLSFCDLDQNDKITFDADKLQQIALEELKIDISKILRRGGARSPRLETFGQEKDIKPVEYVLDNVISKRSTTLLYAPTGKGKTWFAMCIAQALCHGTSVFGNDKRWIASRPQRVVYIDSEMNQANFHRRLQILEKIYARDGQDFYPLKYKQVGIMNMNLVKDDEEDRDRIKINEWLAEEEDAGRPVDLLILDNLSTLSGFNDSAKAWDNMSKWMKELSNRSRNPIAVLVVHHSNKLGDQRGSSAKTATVDNVIYLEPQEDDKKKDEEKKQYRKKGVLNFIVHITKGRDIPDHSGSDSNFPVELSLATGKEACTIVCPAKDEFDRKKEALAYLDKKKVPPHEVIAVLTGLSVNTVRQYSHELGKTKKGNDAS